MIIHVARDEKDWPGEFKFMNRRTKRGAVPPGLGLRGGVVHTTDAQWEKRVKLAGQIYVDKAIELGMIRIEHDSSLVQPAKRSKKKGD